MLCGDIPYTTDREICSGRLVWQKHVKLSKEAKDLMQQCLHMVPELRINLDSILSHPWFSDHSGSSSSSLKPSSSSMSTSPAESPSLPSSSLESASSLSENLLVSPSASSGRLVWQKHVKLSKEAKDLMQRCLHMVPELRINL